MGKAYKVTVNKDRDSTQMFSMLGSMGKLTLIEEKKWSPEDEMQNI